MLTVWDEFQSAGRWRDPLTELLADGTIRPVVAESFPFERSADAHRFISERRNVGKVVLRAMTEALETAARNQADARSTPARCARRSS